MTLHHTAPVEVAAVLETTATSSKAAATASAAKTATPEPASTAAVMVRHCARLGSQTSTLVGRKYTTIVTLQRHCRERGRCCACQLLKLQSTPRNETERVRLKQIDWSFRHKFVDIKLPLPKVKIHEVCEY